jgi:DNA-binding Lrp family transcriptional regulator
MHQNPCPDMISGKTNIVKFCKKPHEASGLTQFEIVRAIYDSGILAENGLSPATKLVIIALAHHFNPKREDMFPSQKFIAKKLGISERSAERAVAELKKVGLITYETQRVNHYKFTEKFFESVKMSDKSRQNVGNDTRQNVGQTNKHEQIKNNFKKENIFSNQPKGMKYMDLKPSKYIRDERTPENDLQTAQNYVKELLPMSQNPLIKAKLDKIFQIWGAEKFAIQAEIPLAKKPETQGHT